MKMSSINGAPLLLPLSPSEYFDETIFTDGTTFLMNSYGTVNAFNNADRYLLGRLGITVGDDCSGDTTKPVIDQNETIIVNLNPRRPCRGINIYSMDMLNKNNSQIQQVVSFNQISIFDGDTNVPIYIGEHVEGNIYTVGSLTSFESAIMVKYFAINNSIFITRHLFNFIKRHFRDHRSWFNYNSIGIVQNTNGELVDSNNEIINIPDLTISQPAIFL